MNSEEFEETRRGAASVGTETAVAVDIDDEGLDAAEKRLAEIDETEQQEAAADPEADLDEQIRNNILRNVTLADAEMRMFGDRTVLAQVAQLVAYIRHAVKNNAPTDIKVSICKSDSTVSDAEFMFDLNGCQVPDLVPQAEVFIN